MIIQTANPNYKFHTREVPEPNSDILVINECWNENVYDVDINDFATNVNVIDLGANIGAFSVFAASIANKIKVYAYEPQADNFDLLKKNVELNNQQAQVMPIQRAVGKKAGKSYISNAMGNSQMTKQKEGKMVPVDTLESIFTNNGITECAVLKLDVEGAEYDIFSLDTVSVETLRRIQYLTMEFSETTPEKYGLLLASLSRVFNIHAFGSYDTGGYIYGRRY